MRLDGGVDRDEVAVRCEEAFRTVAPARLAAKLDDCPQGTGRRRSGPTG